MLVNHTPIHQVSHSCTLLSTCSVMHPSTHACFSSICSFTHSSVPFVRSHTHSHIQPSVGPSIQSVSSHQVLARFLQPLMSGLARLPCIRIRQRSANASVQGIALPGHLRSRIYLKWRYLWLYVHTKFLASSPEGAAAMSTSLCLSLCVFVCLLTVQLSRCVSVSVPDKCSLDMMALLQIC